MADGAENTADIRARRRFQPPAFAPRSASRVPQTQSCRRRRSSPPRRTSAPTEGSATFTCLLLFYYRAPFFRAGSSCGESQVDQQDRQAIEGLFQRIAGVAQRSGPRDQVAEAFIQAQIARQPSAPYYMAQTILVQEQALNDAEKRIEESENRRLRTPAPSRQPAGPWGTAQGAGGGFLAGAAQTAMGVAGGVLLGNMLAGWFTTGPAAESDAEANQSMEHLMSRALMPVISAAATSISVISE